MGREQPGPRCIISATTQALGLEKQAVNPIMAPMTTARTSGHTPLYLGIEAGGTRTVAMTQSRDGKHCKRIELGPANLRLLTDQELVRHFRAVARALPKPTALAIGMAGTRTEPDRNRIRKAAAIVWPAIGCHATNDLETALMAVQIPSRELGTMASSNPVPDTIKTRAKHSTRVQVRRRADLVPRVLVLSGTGSCCFGRTSDGRTAKMGGWGHVLGDKGSGYEIGLRALKAVVYYYDRDGEWPSLGSRLLRALQLNEPDDFITWAQQADKTQIAALAPEVFQAWSKRDRVAADILEGAANSLAKDAVCCASHLVKKNEPVQFVLAGGILIGQPRFARQVRQQLQRRWPGSIVTSLKREGVIGAVALAQMHFPADSPACRPLDSLQLATSNSARARTKQKAATSETYPTPQQKTLAATEQRNPLSMDLDKLPLEKAVSLMLREDAKLPAKLLAQKKSIARGVRLIVRSFQAGGRLFYVGAGTSGRLGVLDASECPPTFRTDPDMVQGLMAGGQVALWRAVEGAEDDPAAGARAINCRHVTSRDIVVGIAASGRTPFVWGALGAAKNRGASTILLCFNHTMTIPRSVRPTLVIAPRIGPEILTGSTRLKAGTATKLILNIFTTLAMVRLGKVLGNLMIDVKASNAKLQDRAIRMVQELTGENREISRAALIGSKWEIRAACARLGRR